MTRIKNRLAQEEGFTLIELLVSAVILVVGVFGLVSAVDGSQRLSTTAEQQTVAAQVAERELDLAVTLPFNSVALSSTPACSSAPCGSASVNDTDRWNYYLTSPRLLPQTSGSTNCSVWNSSNGSTPGLNQAPNDETTCVDSCPSVAAASGCPAVGGIAPTSSVTVPTASGNKVRLKVYRYVTWVNDTACGSRCPNIADTGYKGDYKRVTIAVLPVSRQVSSTTGLPALRSAGGPREPVIVSSVRNWPDRGKANAKGNSSPCSGAGTVIIC